MNGYECLLAAVLLTTPVESTDLAPHLELVQPTFLQLAIAAEILDSREDQYLQGLSKSLTGDYAALRDRFEALQCAPVVAECERFPSRSVTEEFLAFNRAYRKEVQACLECYPSHADHLQPILNEIDQRYFLWSAVRDARCGFYYVTVRRQALQQMRDVLGTEAFYRGEVPPHVPLWCFPRLK